MVQCKRSKKRPCKICRKWFFPDPRVGDRQKTCATTECKRKWHAKKCAEWNRKNRGYFQEIYLSGKLQAASVAKDKEPDTTISSLLAVTNNDFFPRYPRQLVQEVIGTQQVVIIDYIARLLVRSVKEVIRSQPCGITRKSQLLLPEGNLRSDGVARSP